MSYSFDDSLQAGSGWNQFRPDPVYIIVPQVNLEFEVYMQKTYTLRVDKKNQLDVTLCIFYFSSNSCSTCFGQPCAHHQELTTG